MPAHPPVAPGQVLRHFTVAVFVVHRRHVLLHFHRKLARWLPPGGHIEADELPDEAALREVLEETGIQCQLVGERGLPIDEPRQLVLPVGIQVEPIYPATSTSTWSTSPGPIQTTPTHPKSPRGWPSATRSAGTR
jgi:8-oxo-dGTP pyrophosphatase MutT (NUDIX family)